MLIRADYWRPLVEFLQEPLLASGAIDRDDIDRIFVTDDVEDATALIRATAMSKFGLTERPMKRRWYLGETA